MTKASMTILGILILVLTGCMLLHTEKPYPFPTGKVVVSGNKIFCDGQPFAEVRYFDPVGFEITEQMHVGLVVYYYQADKEVWVFPKKGMSVYEYHTKTEFTSIEDMRRVWQKYIQERKEQREGNLDYRDRTIDAGLYVEGKRLDKLMSFWVGEVRISDDGKYIAYKASGLFWPSYHKYLVEYGISR